MRNFHSCFTLVTDFKVRLRNEFKDQVPQSTIFSVDYFEGCHHSTKYWIFTEHDINVMHNHCHSEIMLWCDGHTADELTAKHPRPEGRALNYSWTSDNFQ